MMFLSKSLHEKFLNIPSDITWLNFKELCSLISTLYLCKYNYIFFSENDEKEIKAYFYNDTNQESIVFEDALKGFCYPLFLKYQNGLKCINKENYPDLFTAWFYLQVISSNEEIHIYFKNRKIFSNFIKIELNKYNSELFFDLLFGQYHLNYKNFTYFEKKIFILKKYIDTPFCLLDEIKKDKLNKLIRTINRITMYSNREYLEMTILSYALEKCCDDWLITLYKSGLIIDSYKYIKDIIFWDKNKFLNYVLCNIDRKLFLYEDYLHYCAFNNKYNSLVILLKYGVDINSQNDKGITALMIAASKIDYKMVEILLEHNANVNIEDSHGIIASEKIPSWDFADDLFLKLENIRKNNKGA